MAHQSLYRRYRPRRFGEVRGQDHVVVALRNAVEHGTEGHAYLFSGPRGTGKTSTARILAKALNCENLQGGEPCCDCTPCQDMEAGRSYDLFELDAASNNGVDAIRDLIERAAVGSPGRTKVYILDEVHMLSPGASNALLKTLEEPPDHVRFVLATTDPQKVLPTIRSRTQHFEFQLLSADELESYVRWIGSDADLDVDEESIAWAVRQGRGSARDTLSALDQVVAAGGVVSRSEPVDELFAAVTGRDAGAAISAVADALSQGHDPRVLAKAFLDSLRDAFLLSLGVEVPHLVDADRASLDQWAQAAGTPLLTRAMEAVGAAMVDMRNAADPRVPLEVALVRLASAGDTSVGALVERIERLEAALASGEVGAVSAATNGAAATTAEVAAGRPAAQAVPAARSVDELAADAGGEPPAAATQPAPGAGGGPAQARAELKRLREANAPSAVRDGAPGAPAPSAPAPSAPVPTTPAPGAAAPRPPASRPPASQSPGPQPPAPVPPVSEPRRGAAPPVPPVPTASSTSSTAPAPQEPPSTPSSAASSGADASAGTGAAAGEGAPDDDGASPGSASAPTGSGLPTLEALRAALTDVVLPQLKGVAKALYGTGEMVSVGPDGAVFALAVGVPRDRAERAVPEVEQHLAAHFGHPVPLRVVEHHADEALEAPRPGGVAPSQRVGPAQNGSPAEPETTEQDDSTVIDVHSLENADVSRSGLERLSEVFPGATVVDEDEVTR